MVVLMAKKSSQMTGRALACVLTFGIATLVPGTHAAQETKIVEITAERFTFTPSEIRVKAGTRLEIRLRSDDTAHGFRIIGTDVNVELPKRGRGIATVNFEPQAGRYTFECSQLCGAGHEFMRGVIIAE
jgi:cytochrome c oxidase subunit II